jgi:uncharacterized cupredoxin-like copper-binding protein
MKGIRKFAAIGAMALIVLPLLSACGPTVVTVSLTSYTITADKVEVPAGKVTFKVTNDATDQVHEFVVVSSDAKALDLPRDAEGKADENAVAPVDEVEDIAIGESKELTVDLKPGHYILLCNLPGHYGQGMAIDFVVK